MKDYWTTADGKEVAYRDLTDDHLKNIIKDGYRNQNLIYEAQRRNIPVPTRKVDELTYQEIINWVESFCSCAIEGNKLGKKMCDLWGTDEALFLFHLNKMLEDTDNDTHDRM